MTTNTLQTFISKQLNSGPIPAAQVMEWALYHPTLGYYRQTASPWGFEGKDYYTALDCGPLLGETLALRLEAAWRELGEPETFQVLEPGAGRGWLGRDILTAAQGDFAKALTYLHQDDNPAARNLAQEALQPFAERVHFIGQEEPLEAFTGAILSNELFDALPAQPWRYTEGGWELEVLTQEGPRWIPGSPEEAGEWFSAQAEGGLNPGDGSLWVEDLPKRVQKLAHTLKRGLFLAIDYGDTAPRLLAKGADLRRYKAHQVDGRWWEDLGRCDLTADVDFTRLSRLLEESGIKELQTQSLSHWIRKHAPLMAWETTWQSLESKERQKRMENLLALTLPGMMGERFKVLEGWRI